MVGEEKKFEGVAGCKICERIQNVKDPLYEDGDVVVVLEDKGKDKYLVALPKCHIGAPDPADGLSLDNHEAQYRNYQRVKNSMMERLLRVKREHYDGAGLRTETSDQKHCFIKGLLLLPEDEVR